MNEQLKALWEQAGGEFDAGNQWTYPEYRIGDPKKFAELIVQECANLFDKNETELSIPEHRVHNSIMIHFGLY